MGVGPLTISVEDKGCSRTGSSDAQASITYDETVRTREFNQPGDGAISRPRHRTVVRGVRIRPCCVLQNRDTTLIGAALRVASRQPNIITAAVASDGKASPPCRPLSAFPCRVDVIAPIIDEHSETTICDTPHSRGEALTTTGVAISEQESLRHTRRNLSILTHIIVQ